jgi:hypothetical protein
MKKGPRLAWAIAAAGASVASAQTLHLEFSPIGLQAEETAEFSLFTGIGHGVVALPSGSPGWPVRALVARDSAAFNLPAGSYSGSSDAVLHSLSDADFKTLGIDLALPNPRSEETLTAPRPAASFLASQVAPVTSVAASLPSDPELFVHAVPLPPSVIGAGGLLAGMALLRARRLRG